MNEYPPRERGGGVPKFEKLTDMLLAVADRGGRFFDVVPRPAALGDSTVFGTRFVVDDVDDDDAILLVVVRDFSLFRHLRPRRRRRRRRSLYLRRRDDGRRRRRMAGHHHVRLQDQVQPPPGGCARRREGEQFAEHAEGVRGWGQVDGESLGLVHHQGEVDQEGG